MQKWKNIWKWLIVASNHSKTKQWIDFKSFTNIYHMHVKLTHKHLYFANSEHIIKQAELNKPMY